MLSVDCSNEKTYDKNENNVISLNISSTKLDLNFVKLSKSSKLFRDELLKKIIPNKLTLDIQHAKEQYNIKDEVFIDFFKLINGENIPIKDINFYQLNKLADIFEVQSLRKKLDEIDNDSVDFIIQQIYNNINSNSIDVKMSIENEEYLSKNIVKCFNNQLFGQFPISTIYRIIEKGDKKFLSSDKLYDFISQSFISRIALFNFITFQDLSEDKFKELYKKYSDFDSDQKKMIDPFLPYNLDYIDELKKEKRSYVNKCNELNEEIKKYQKQIEEITKERNEFENQIFLLKNEQKEFQNTIELISKSKEELQNEIIQIKEQFQSNTTQITNQNYELQKTITQIKSENNELQNTLKQTTYKNNELQNTITQISSENDELQNTITQITSENDELHNAFNQITSKNDELQKTINQITNDKKQLQSKIDEMTKNKNVIQTGINQQINAHNYNFIKTNIPNNINPTINHIQQLKFNAQNANSDYINVAKDSLSQINEIIKKESGILLDITFKTLLYWLCEKDIPELVDFVLFLNIVDINSLIILYLFHTI